MTDEPLDPPVAVVVLAGGRSRRFGSDKLAAPLRGSTVLDETLAGLPVDWPVVVVGDRRTTMRSVTWTREEPPGGGPLAGVAAGLALVAAEVVAVVAGDMPDAGPALADLVATLRAAPPEVEAVVATDAEGVANPLLAAYRTSGRPRPPPVSDRRADRHDSCSAWRTPSAGSPRRPRATSTSPPTSTADPS